MSQGSHARNRIDGHSVLILVAVMKRLEGESQTDLNMELSFFNFIVHV